MDSPLSRRSLLAGAAAGLFIGSRGVFGNAGEEPQAGFKIGACDWTLGKRNDPGSFEVAKRIGLDGVQVDLGTPAEGEPLCAPAVRDRFLAASQDQGVQIASVALGTLNDNAYKSDPRTERWVSESIEACKGLGASVVLLAFFGNGDLRDDPAGVDVVVERLKKVAPKAEEAGVFISIESWLSADELLKIIERVGSPQIKVYYDVGNAHKVGLDIYKEIRQLGTEHICEFHAKDYDDLYGKGSINFPEVRRAMDDIGYRGWINIEGVKLPLGLEESIRYDAEYLRTIFPAKV